MSDSTRLELNKAVSSWEAIVYLIGICSLIIHVIIFEGYSELFVFPIFLILGLLVFKNDNKKYFLLAFSINVFAAVIHGLFFYYARGETFSAGSDDKHFYTQVLNLLDGRKVTLGNYGLYIYINYGVYDLCDFFGLNDRSYLLIALLNAFVGASIAPALNSISLMYFPKYVAKKIVYLVIYFPILISFSGMLLRDIWVATIFLWVVQITISNRNMFAKIFLCVLLSWISFSFRAANGVVTLLFFVSYYFYMIKSKWLKFAIAAVAIFIFFAVFYQSISAVQDLTSGKYKEFAQNTSSENSVGMKMAFSTNPFVRGVYFVIVLYNPVPPFHGALVDDIFIGLGAIIWYIIVPGFVLGLFKAMTDEKFKSLAFSFGTAVLVLLLALFTISGSERHKLLIYPLAFFFFVYYLQNFSKEFRIKVAVIYCSVIVLAVSVYAVLKLQLI